MVDVIGIEPTTSSAHIGAWRPGSQLVVRSVLAHI